MSILIQLITNTNNFKRMAGDSSSEQKESEFQFNVDIEDFLGKLEEIYTRSKFSIGQQQAMHSFPVGSFENYLASYLTVFLNNTGKNPLKYIAQVLQKKGREEIANNMRFMDDYINSDPFDIGQKKRFQNFLRTKYPDYEPKKFDASKKAKELRAENNDTDETQTNTESQNLIRQFDSLRLAVNLFEKTGTFGTPYEKHTFQYYLFAYKYQELEAIKKSGNFFQKGLKSLTGMNSSGLNQESLDQAQLLVDQVTLSDKQIILVDTYFRQNHPNYIGRVNIQVTEVIKYKESLPELQVKNDQGHFEGNEGEKVIDLSPNETILYKIANLIKKRESVEETEKHYLKFYEDNFPHDFKEFERPRNINDAFIVQAFAGACYGIVFRANRDGTTKIVSQDYIMLETKKASTKLSDIDFVTRHGIDVENKKFYGDGYKRTIFTPQELREINQQNIEADETSPKPNTPNTFAKGVLNGLTEYSREGKDYIWEKYSKLIKNSSTTKGKMKLMRALEADEALQSAEMKDLVNAQAESGGSVEGESLVALQAKIDRAIEFVTANKEKIRKGFKESSGEKGIEKLYTMLTVCFNLSSQYFIYYNSLNRTAKINSINLSVSETKKELLKLGEEANKYIQAQYPKFKKAFEEGQKQASQAKSEESPEGEVFDLNPFKTELETIQGLEAESVEQFEVALNFYLKHYPFQNNKIEKITTFKDALYALDFTINCSLCIKKNLSPEETFRQTISHKTNSFRKLTGSMKLPTKIKLERLFKQVLGEHYTCEYIQNEIKDQIITPEQTTSPEIPTLEEFKRDYKSEMMLRINRISVLDENHEFRITADLVNQGIEAGMLSKEWEKNPKLTKQVIESMFKTLEFLLPKALIDKMFVGKVDLYDFLLLDRLFLILNELVKKVTHDKAIKLAIIKEMLTAIVDDTDESKYETKYNAALKVINNLEIVPISKLDSIQNFITKYIEIGKSQLKSEYIESGYQYSETEIEDLFKSIPQGQNPSNNNVKAFFRNLNNLLDVKNTQTQTSTEDIMTIAPEVITGTSNQNPATTGEPQQQETNAVNEISHPKPYMEVKSATRTYTNKELENSTAETELYLQDFYGECSEDLTRFGIARSEVYICFALHESEMKDRANDILEEQSDGNYEELRRLVVVAKKTFINLPTEQQGLIKDLYETSGDKFELDLEGFYSEVKNEENISFEKLPFGRRLKMAVEMYTDFKKTNKYYGLSEELFLKKFFCGLVFGGEKVKEKVEDLFANQDPSKELVIGQMLARYFDKYNALMPGDKKMVDDVFPDREQKGDKLNSLEGKVLDIKDNVEWIKNTHLLIEESKSNPTFEKNYQAFRMQFKLFESLCPAIVIGIEPDVVDLESAYLAVDFASFCISCVQDQNDTLVYEYSAVKQLMDNSKKRKRHNRSVSDNLLELIKVYVFEKEALKTKNERPYLLLKRFIDDNFGYLSEDQKEELMVEMGGDSSFQYEKMINEIENAQKTGSQTKRKSIKRRIEQVIESTPGLTGQQTPDPQNSETSSQEGESEGAQNQPEPSTVKQTIPELSDEEILDAGVEAEGKTKDRVEAKFLGFKNQKFKLFWLAAYYADRLKEINAMQEEEREREMVKLLNKINKEIVENPEQVQRVIRRIKIINGEDYLGNESIVSKITEVIIDEDFGNETPENSSEKRVKRGKKKANSTSTPLYETLLPNGELAGTMHYITTVAEQINAAGMTAECQIFNNGGYVFITDGLIVIAQEQKDTQILYNPNYETDELKLLIGKFRSNNQTDSKSIKEYCFYKGFKYAEIGHKNIAVKGNTVTDGLWKLKQQDFIEEPYENARKWDINPTKHYDESVFEQLTPIFEFDELSALCNTIKTYEGLADYQISVENPEEIQKLQTLLDGLFKKNIDANTGSKLQAPKTIDLEFSKPQSQQNPFVDNELIQDYVQSINTLFDFVYRLSDFCKGNSCTLATLRKDKELHAVLKRASSYVSQFKAIDKLKSERGVYLNTVKGTLTNVQNEVIGMSTNFDGKIPEVNSVPTQTKKPSKILGIIPKNQN